MMAFAAKIFDSQRTMTGNAKNKKTGASSKQTKSSSKSNASSRKRSRGGDSPSNKKGKVKKGAPESRMNPVAFAFPC